MEKAPFIEPLLERTEQYRKVMFELGKLKLTSRASDIASTLASRSLFMLILALFTFTLTIGISLWIGDVLGKSYYGFLAVASFYGLIGIIVYFLHPWIKERIRSSLISQLLK